MVWERPVLGRWFEDLEVGLVVAHALTRTITEADNINFSLSTLNPAPLHLDRHYAAQTEFGRPLVNSMFTLALLVGISVHETTHGTTVANLGFESVAFPAPVFPGDTIHAETRVLEVKESSSKPDRRVVTVETKGFNQDGNEVCYFKRKVLIWKRDAAPQRRRPYDGVDVWKD